jgi:hypothetical protein
MKAKIIEGLKIERSIWAKVRNIGITDGTFINGLSN